MPCRNYTSILINNSGSGTDLSGRILTVRVTPKAKSNRIVTVDRDDGSVLYKVYVTDAPTDGKANKAVVQLLATFLGVAKTQLVILSGATSRDKRIRVG